MKGTAPRTSTGAKRWWSARRWTNRIVEVQEARRLQIPVIPRGELLAELMRLKYGIAVAGSHGKTTTTSMIATILTHAGMDPTVVVGGKAATHGRIERARRQERFSGGRVGRKRRIVSEAVAHPCDRDQHRSRASGSLSRTSRPFAPRSLSSSTKCRFMARRLCAWTTRTCRAFCPPLSRRTITYGRNSQAEYQPAKSECGDFQSHFQLALRARKIWAISI